MIDNPRGPYSRIVWFCNDGEVLPPVPYGCQDHGGGRQHGEYSPQRERLAELGWSVGTVFAALSWEEFFDADRRNGRLRELALERYLTDIDDGWVLRQARNYRGRVQVEGEEAAGRSLLLELFGDTEWLTANYLLARESVRVVPHTGSADNVAQDARRRAIEVVEQDKTFEPLRAEIHTAPSAATAARVRAWADTRTDAPQAAARELADQLDLLFGSAGRGERLEMRRAALARRPASAALAAQLTFDGALPPRARLARLAGVLRDARATIQLPDTSAATRLLLFDLLTDVGDELSLTAGEILADRTLSRGELLDVAKHLVDAGYGTGLLTAGEHAALAALWPHTDDADAPPTSLPTDAYAKLNAYLRRIPQWAVGSMRFAFAEPLVRYAALDPRAGGFVDDVLRGSALVGIAEVSRRLAQDLAYLTGVAQNINGETGVAAFGLNPGIARGPLRIFANAAALEAGAYTRDDVVLLPETVAELEPVAGIVTLGEGNPLSHVQLLARNFAIPNIAIVPTLLPVLAPLAGREVLASVASDGSVALVPAADVPSELLASLTARSASGQPLTVPPPDLGLSEPIPLRDLRASLSGHVVGPKAANLGELAYLFPGRVAPALAIPFGIFAAALTEAEPSIHDRLVEAYAEDAAGFADPPLAAMLATIRADIAALSLDDDLRARLRAAMFAEFGEPGTYGLFVRSDTNVEDLPQFTGAGLSETLPNVIGEELIFAAIPRVWASVLSPRAIAWRSSLLTNPAEVYASVLLMKSVPSDKSGVMVTTDIAAHAPGLTISTAWGVGGAVGGEAAETLVLHPDGSETLISEAKTAYRRKLNEAGGLQWQPAADGPVLAAAEKDALRRLAAEVGDRYAPAYDGAGRARPWDIEFGFVGGELTLFQIRPLVEQGPELADRVVRALTARRDVIAPGRVALAEPPIAAGGL